MVNNLRSFERSELERKYISLCIFLTFGSIHTKLWDFVKLRPVPNAAPLMCRTKLNTVRLWSDFGATADSDGVLVSDLIREGHGKYFSMRKICDLNSLTLSK